MPRSSIDDDHFLEAAEAYSKAAELGYREDTAAYNAACSYALAGRKDDAFTWLNKAMELGFDVASYLGRDDDLDSLRRDPRFAELKKAARAAKAEGKTADSVRAVKHFEKLTAEGSKNGARWYEAGKELLDAEKLDLSEKAFRTAASLGYRTGASTYNAACALARAGKVPQALDTLDASLEAGFDDPGLIGRDDDLDALHDDPRFAQLRKKAEDLTLSMSDIGTGAARLFRRRSAWREEVPHYAAYAKAHPQSGRAHYNLGYAQLLAERPEAALPAFTRALELGYRKAATLYNLACAHARLEEKDKAFERLFQAIDAGYDSPVTDPARRGSRLAARRSALQAGAPARGEGRRRGRLSEASHFQQRNSHRISLPESSRDTRTAKVPGSPLAHSSLISSSTRRLRRTPRNGGCPARRLRPSRSSRR